MDTIKKNFRGTFGLDAAGEKVINVGTADRSVMSDGVNVEYFFQENTIQTYKTDRAYIKGFAVIHNDKIWVSQVDIAEPSGPFNEGQWKPIRVDPKWVLIQGGTRVLKSGEYLTVDSALNTPIEFTLPVDAIDGDTIVIRDIGGRVGYSSVLTKASSQSIRHKGASVREYQMTIPYSEMVYVYNNRLWNLFVQAPDDYVSTASTTAPFDAQAGNVIVRRYLQLNPITIRLPKYANNGDLIQFVGMDHPSVPYFHCIINTFDAATSVITPGQRSLEVKYALNGYFIYNAETSTWGLYDGNVQDRLRTVGADTNLFPGETVSVVGQNNTDLQTINLTLPTNVQPGDQTTVALNYMRKGQTVKIIAGGTDKILTDQNMMQFPKRSSYPPAGNWVNTTELVFNGSTSYPPIITFAYIPMGPISQWMVVENVPQLERVDPTDASTRARLGVIALATQAQADLSKEDIQLELNKLAREVAITPETLASRVALEGRTGIARIATTVEVNQASNASYLDNVIVTPKKLNERVATETMRGLAEIADDTEAKSNTNDTHILTPKKLDSRRASSDLSGVVQLVQTNGVASTSRTAPGTFVFNYNDNARVITPATLREFQATENQLGAGFLALDTEVIAGTSNPANGPLLVTPVQLHKKTATESRHGFTETATQDETNAGTDDFRYITPKKLAGRVALENQTGVAKVATQPEFDAGLLDNVISTPLKIKNRFNDKARTSVSANSGLIEAGTLWDHYTLDISEAKESQRGTLKLSTQDQVNVGTDDTTAVTPKKLQAKKATTSTEGIVQIATKTQTEVGTSEILAVSPGGLKNAVQIEKTWEAQVAVRGTVKMTENALTFVGNDTAGNTQDIELYQKTGFAISPYELNKTLLNFMPRKAKAVDSELLDGIDSSQFVRRDIDQTVAGNIAFQQGISTVGKADIGGILTVGTKGNVDYGVTTTRVKLIPPQYSGVWDINLRDDQTGGNNATFAIGYNALSQPFVRFHTVNQKIEMNGNLEVNGAASVSGALSVNTSIHTNRFALNNDDVITRGTPSEIILFGNQANRTWFRSSDANDLTVQDPSGSFKVLNEKNMKTLLDPMYVNSTGDTMTGKLTITAPVASTFTGVTSVNIHQNPTAQSIGMWSVEITDSAIYNQLNGYLVPVYETHPDTGLPYVARYDEVKSSGTLTQLGNDLKTAQQIWQPKPTVTTDLHTANTTWIRQFNVAKNTWDGFGRVYNSNLPPTASDIGAISNDGSALNNLRIRDWIQIGNLRIYPDPQTRSVKFDWID